MTEQNGAGVDNAGVRHKLTPKMIAVLDVLSELPEDMNYMGFKGIAAEACGRIQFCDVRRTTRHLWRKGLVEFGRGLWSDDGMPKGSGYCITPAGRAALSKATPQGGEDER